MDNQTLSFSISGADVVNGGIGIYKMDGVPGNNTLIIASFCCIYGSRDTNGFSQRKVRNRAKSPSVEQSVSPCSTASAARCASGTRFPWMPGNVRNSPSSSGCRSVGCGIHTVPQASHALACRHASPIGSGCSNTRGLLTSLRKASTLAHGSPTELEPFNCWSSHWRALACCGNELTCA